MDDFGADNYALDELAGKAMTFLALNTEVTQRLSV